MVLLSFQPKDPKMTPSISKTVVLEEEESLLRKRIISAADGDHNNNKVEANNKSYKIDDINYLTAETTNSASQREGTENGSQDTDTKPDYSNWKPQIRWVGLTDDRICSFKC